MKYNTLVVCLDDGPRSADRLEFALTLAERQGARLIGMYRPGGSPLDEGSLCKSALRRSWACSERAYKKRHSFLDRALNRGVSAEWFDMRRTGLTEALHQAQHADLIIVGQRPPRLVDFRLGKDLLEHFLLDVGRPILVTPSAGALDARFDCIAIAWNGSPEAARAVADALPVLERADRVIVLTVRQPPARSQQAPLEVHVLDYLARHGIEAELIENFGVEKIGDWLLYRSELPGIEADLLVAGAYGHHRLGEHLLGGVTDTLLRDSTVPVLMSH